MCHCISLVSPEAPCGIQLPLAGCWGPRPLQRPALRLDRLPDPAGPLGRERQHSVVPICISPTVSEVERAFPCLKCLAVFLGRPFPSRREVLVSWGRPLLSRAVCCRYCLPVSSCVTYSPLPLPGPRVLAQAAGTSRTPQAARTAAVCSSRSWRAGRPRSGRWQPWWAVRTVFLARGPAWAMSPRGLSSCVLGERRRAPAPSPPPMRSLIPPGAPPWWPQDPR